MINKYSNTSRVLLSVFGFMMEQRVIPRLFSDAVSFQQIRSGRVVKILSYSSEM